MKYKKAMITIITACLLSAMCLAACARPANAPSNDRTSEQAQDQTSGQPADSTEDPAQDPDDDEGLLSEEEAIAIVLARVEGASAEDIVSFSREFDDGTWQYEGSLLYNGIEYEFEIDARNGNLLDWEIDD